MHGNALAGFGLLSHWTFILFFLTEPVLSSFSLDLYAVGEGARWGAEVRKTIEALAVSMHRQWNVQCVHVERVKSYAPRVDHFVADIWCQQIQ